jgi:hypothetical protein
MSLSSAVHAHEFTGRRRVNKGDLIGELLGSEVVCILFKGYPGERCSKSDVLTFEILPPVQRPPKRDASSEDLSYSVEDLQAHLAGCHCHTKSPTLYKLTNDPGMILVLTYPETSSKVV